MIECNVFDRVKPVFASNAHGYCSRKEELNKSNGDNHSLIFFWGGGVCSVNGDLLRLASVDFVHRCLCIIVYERRGQGVVGVEARDGWLKGFIGYRPRRTAAAFGDPPAVPISEDITCQQLPANG